MSTTTYTVLYPMRWDMVAYAAYGDATKFSVIIEANPNVPVSEILDAGIVLNIPILEEPDVTESLLPPWKR